MEFEAKEIETIILEQCKRVQADSCPHMYYKYMNYKFRYKLALHPKHQKEIPYHWWPVDYISDHLMKSERRLKRSCYHIDQAVLSEFNKEEMRLRFSKEQGDYLKNHFRFLYAPPNLSMRDLTIFFIYLKYLMTKL